MNRHPVIRFLVACLVLCVAACPPALQACATCYGASDAPMAQGMNWGIMSLLVVIGSVLGGIVSFFVYVGRRSSRSPLTLPEPTSVEN